MLGATFFGLIVLIFGNVGFAKAAAENCTWTNGGGDGLMSTAANWLKEGGGPCVEIGTGDNLAFDSETGTTTSAVWDSGIAQAVATVIVSSSYSGTITFAADSTVSVDTNMTIRGGTVVSASVGAVSIAALNIESGGTLTNNSGTGRITVSGALDNAGTMTNSGDMTVAGAFTNSGTYTKGAAGSLILNNNFSNTGTFTDTAGTTTASSTSANFGGAGNTTLYNFNVSSTLTLTGGVTSTNILTINASHSLDASTLLILLTKASGVPLVINGTFISSSSTVRYSGATSATIATTTYYNLTIDTAGTISGAATTTNDLVVNSGKSLTGSSNSLNLGGNLDNSGTITGLGLRTYGSSDNIGGSGNTTLASLNITGDLATLTGNVTSTTSLLVSGGKTFNLSTYDLVVDSGIAINGGSIITQASGTFTMSGTGNIDNSGGYIQFAAMNMSGTVSLTGTGNVTSTATTTISGTLNGNEDNILTLAGSGTPLVITGTFNVNSSTVVYTSSTANVAAITYYNLTIDGTDTLVGNVTTTNVLTINSSKSLNAGAYTIVLSATGTPFVDNGTFTSSSSTVNYTSTGSVTTTGETYWNLTLGAGTYLMSDNTTSTNSFTNAGTSTIASGKTLSVPGTFDNNGTITETGIIKHTMTSAKLSDSIGAEQTNYGSGSETVYVTVQDDDGNLDVGSVDTITVGTGSAITTDSYSDSESITSLTLTETGVNTGIFVGTAYPFQVVASKTNDNSKFDVSGSGTLTLAFVDNKDSTDSGADTATFTGSTYTAPSSGGGGSSGAVAPIVISPSSAIQIKDGLKEVVSPKITLQLSSTNATLMAISNEVNFAGASWEQYSGTKEWVLSAGDGEKTVYAKFRSVSGGETPVYSLKIVLKSGMPVSSIDLLNIGSANFETSLAVVSNIAIAGITKFTYAPYAKIKYTYAYKNAGAKNVKIKVVRQLLNSKGKVLRTSSATTSLKPKAIFKRNISDSVVGVVGKYTVKIRILDAKNKLIEENTFKYDVVKPKKK